MGTVLFMIRIDHLTYDDYASNPLLNILVMHDYRELWNHEFRTVFLVDGRIVVTNSGGRKTTTSLFAVLRATYPGMCDGRSIWVVDCRKSDDPDNDKSLRKHNGRNPGIKKSISESKNNHALHSRFYDGMHRFFSW